MSIKDYVSRRLRDLEDPSRDLASKRFVDSGSDQVASPNTFSNNWLHAPAAQVKPPVQYDPQYAPDFKSDAALMDFLANGGDSVADAPLPSRNGQAASDLFSSALGGEPMDRGQADDALSAVIGQMQDDKTAVSLGKEPSTVPDRTPVLEGSRPFDPLEALLGGPVPAGKPSSGTTGAGGSEGGSTTDKDKDKDKDKDTAGKPEGGAEADDPLAELLYGGSGSSSTVEDVLGRYAANTGGRASSAAVSAAAKAGAAEQAQLDADRRDRMVELLKYATDDQRTAILKELWGSDLPSAGASGSGDGEAGYEPPYWLEEWFDGSSAEEASRVIMSLTTGDDVDMQRLRYLMREQYPADYDDKIIGLLLYAEDNGYITAEARERYLAQIGL